MASDTIDREAADALLRVTPEFRRLDDAARTLVLDELELRTASAGEVVIHQGDPADGLYVVAAGRLQVSITTEAGDRRVLAEVGRGTVVGEMAVLDDSPRSADVVALRECHLYFLSGEGFQRIIAAHPDALRLITGALVHRLAAGNRGEAAPRSAVRCVTLVPLDPDRSVSDFAPILLPPLTRLATSSRVVTEADADTALGPDATAWARAAWFEDLEIANEITVLVANPDPDAWTRSCLEHADVIVMLARAHGDPAPRAVEELLDLPGISATRVELVLVHEPTLVTPRRTHRWLDPRTVARHHHVRSGHADDAARVVRLLLGKAIGAVFGGGGARGIAHIGVLRALAEHGVPIDATGGTSIGSIIAGAVARDFTVEQTADMLRVAVVDGSPVDLTLPAMSLAAGGKVTERIQAGADGLDLEDGWRNCFCVSTNLTRGAAEIHTRGPGWRAVRASFSVPGIFPPVPNDDGDLLIDGGLVDNLPVGVMRRTHAGIRVVAIDVGATKEPFQVPVPRTGVLSGWGYTWSQLRARNYGNVAGLLKILMRLTELGAQAEPDRGDCALRPGTGAVSLMDFKAFDQLVEIGYRDSMPEIAKWLEGPDAPVF
jgi:predicted acylesterase/phospholipase RssA/CRP-like cAMP-binding protein